MLPPLAVLGLSAEQGARHEKGEQVVDVATLQGMLEKVWRVCLCVFVHMWIAENQAHLQLLYVRCAAKESSHKTYQ